MEESSLSDELRFLIHHFDRYIGVSHLPGEYLLPPCTAGHKQAGGGGIVL